MKLLALIFAGIISLQSTAQAAPVEVESAIRSFVSIYNSSATFLDLVKKMPGGPTETAAIEMLAHGNLETSLDRSLSFDISAGLISFGSKIELRVKAYEKTVVSIRGHEVAWNEKESFSSNLKRVLAVAKATNQSSAWNRMFLPQAKAQLRDFFPDAVGGVHESLEADSVGEALGEMNGTVLKVGLSVVAAFYVVNKIHAILAPSCGDQVNELERMMAADKIGLSTFSCSGYFDQAATIDFWTPDKKKLALVADWGQSTVYIGNEIFKFSSDKLDSVSIGSKTISAADEDFKKFASNIEPYRKVLHLIGRYNSCFKCADAIGKMSAVSPSPLPNVAPALKDTAVTH